jgi:beta-galactosidase
MNNADGYVLNGWAGGDTNTDIVDTYRHPTADTKILSHYNQPLYIAVKLRYKVLPSNSVPVADIFIVNEKNLKGTHALNLSFKAPDGKIIFKKSYNVTVAGREEFGQLLVENVLLPKANQEGYYILNAELKDKTGAIKATGFDDLFAADYKTDAVIPENTVVLDNSGTINSFLKSAFGKTLPDFAQKGDRPKCIVIGANDSTIAGSDLILDMVKKGTNLIVLENTDKWAAKLSVQKIDNEQLMPRSKKGGSLFVGESSLFEGLPSSQAMNWEYQTFYRVNYGGLRIKPSGIETIIANAYPNTPEITIALCRLPFGDGNVILSTLNILPSLKAERPDAAVAKKLFMNMLESAK